MWVVFDPLTARVIAKCWSKVSAKNTVLFHKFGVPSITFEKVDGQHFDQWLTMKHLMKHYASN